VVNAILKKALTGSRGARPREGQEMLDCGARGMYNTARPGGAVTFVLFQW